MPFKSTDFAGFTDYSECAIEVAEFVGLNSPQLAAANSKIAPLGLSLSSQRAFCFFVDWPTICDLCGPCEMFYAFRFIRVGFSVYDPRLIQGAVFRFKNRLIVEKTIKRQAIFSNVVSHTLRNESGNLSKSRGGAMPFSFHGGPHFPKRHDHHRPGVMPRDSVIVVSS